MSEKTIMENKNVPHNFGPLRDYDGNARITGQCGDTMEYWIRVLEGKITHCSFITDGCANSLLCGTIGASLIEGMQVANARKITDIEILSFADSLPEESKHCAVLAAYTIKAAIDDFLHEKKKQGVPEKNAVNSDKNANKSKKYSEINTSIIKYKIIVLSGKGGVGKSTVAVNIAADLSMKGYKVGLLDADIHGPSVPLMLDLSVMKLDADEKGLYPVSVNELNDLKVISIGFLLQEEDNPVIWRGPMKTNVIKQFLEKVHWGELDYLIVDCPPGTGDEPLTAVQTLNNPDGAIIVTTPQLIASSDVSKSINFCRQVKLPIIGIVENMSGFICPKCGTKTDIFKSGGGLRLSEIYDIPLLCSIPIDEDIGKSSDDGVPYVIKHDKSGITSIYDSLSGQIVNFTQLISGK